MKIVILRNDDDIEIMAEADIDVISLVDDLPFGGTEVITINDTNYSHENCKLTVGKKAAEIFNKVVTNTYQAQIDTLEQGLDKLRKNKKTEKQLTDEIAGLQKKISDVTKK